MDKLKTITFAKQADAIINKYKKRVDQGDVIAKNSLDREMKALSEKQEQAKAAQIAAEQPIQQQVPQEALAGIDPSQAQGLPQQFSNGGNLRRKYAGDDPTQSSKLGFSGTTSNNPNTGQQFNADISDEDYTKGKAANEIFKKHQAVLRGVRDSGGKDIKDIDIKKALGPEAYKELETAYNDLNTISKKYDIPSQSFGINDTDTGSSLPQFFGYRFDAMNWDYSQGAKNPDGTVQIQANPQNDYEYYDRDIDPYQIDPKRDIASTAANLGPLAMERNNVDQLKFDRAAPGYVNRENERQQIIAQGKTGLNTGLANVNRQGQSAGQAAANALALQNQSQQNVNNALTRSNEAEVNQNAQLFGRNQEVNARIQQGEALQNYQDRRYVDENEKLRKRAIGNEFSGLSQQLKRNEYDELGLQSVDPNYVFDKDGTYQARRGVRKINNNQPTVYGDVNQLDKPLANASSVNQQGQYDPTVPIVDPTNDIAYSQLELEGQLNPISGQYKWPYKCGGKLKRRK